MSIKRVNPSKMTPTGCNCVLVDEMLAICAEIETWRQKKESQEAQARYNSWHCYRKWNPDEEE